MSRPIEDYSRDRIGATWTHEDHAYLVHHLERIERTHSACVRQSCPLCHGDGWRYVIRNGREITVRCDHTPAAPADGKVRAAGDVEIFRGEG